MRDILDRIGDPELPHSTVSSVVRILEKKGFVDHKAYGKTYEYFPVVTREEYANSGVQSLLQKYFGGGAQAAGFLPVKKEELSEKELAELLRTLSAGKKK